MLKKVNDTMYNYYNEERRMLFTFNKGARGVYGNGSAWYLNVSYAGGDKIHIATFTVKNDGYNCYREDYKGIIWNSMDALEEAQAMVRRFIEN